MTPTQLTELMHAVLDGEATAAQARALERQLASDPAARAEFDALRDIFGRLAALPQAHPPEGLVAAVMAELPAHQLSAPSRVIGTTSDAPSHTNSVRRSSRSWPFQGSDSMSEHSGSKRKVWIGVGLVALAGIIVASSGIDFPPGGTSTSGAIVPAQRYRADQPATTGVGQGGQADVQRSAQPVAGSASDARAADGVRADGRQADAMKADGRAGDAMKADGRQADAMKADGRQADAMKADGRQADAMKADGRQADAMKADGRAGDAMKADGRQADAMKADGRQADAMKADGRQADAMKADGRKADAMKADGRQADAMKADGRAGDAMKADSRAADSLKANGRVSDSRANDGRKSGEGQKEF